MPFMSYHKDRIPSSTAALTGSCSTGCSNPFSSPSAWSASSIAAGELYPQRCVTQCHRTVSELDQGAGRRMGAPDCRGPKGRRDDFVEPHFKGARPDQVVVILKAREP